MELYKKYRPKSLEQIVGNKQIVKMLSELLKTSNLPHSILFTGPSGCGKTTLARILASKLECSKHDLSEINCADFRGIEMIRDIRVQMRRRPIAGLCRIWIIDEAHKLSNDAQNAFLKLLEDTPNHVYFFLATTEPERLLKTIRTRATQVATKPLSIQESQILLERIKETAGLSENVLEKLFEIAEGSARKLLVLAEAIITQKSEQDQLALLDKEVHEKQAIELARELMKPKPTWAVIAEIIKTVDEEPETLRWMILGYATTILLSGGKMAPKAFLVIDSFRDNFYDSKKAGLVAACWEVISCGKS